MHTTVVMNGKGGVGKTTVATNIAGYFAVQGLSTAIMDYDPQGSSLNWLEQRASDAPAIHGADAGSQGGRGGLRSIARHVPRDIERLVVDAPAGPSPMLMKELLARADALVIPVAPSKVDIHATAQFIESLLLVGGLRYRNTRTAVVGNRARSSTAVYEPLERFVRSLRLTFLTHLLDSEIYIESGDTGRSIFELDSRGISDQQSRFQVIVDWLERGSRPGPDASSNVVRFEQGRAREH